MAVDAAGFKSIEDGDFALVGGEFGGFTVASATDDDVHFVIVWEWGVGEVAKFFAIARGVEVGFFISGVHTLHNVEVVPLASCVTVVFVEITGVEFFPGSAVHFDAWRDGSTVDQDSLVAVELFVVAGIIELRQGAAVVIAGEIFELLDESEDVVATLGVAFGGPECRERDKCHNEDYPGDRKNERYFDNRKTFLLIHNLSIV